MKRSTMIVVATLGTVAVLALVLWLLDDKRAGQIGGAVSALAGVAAVGVAIWAALRQSSGRIRVAGTGEAMAGSSGAAVSGLSVQSEQSAALPDVNVEETGRAEATGGGQATSGVIL
ncbi:hypothetical protein AB0M02_35855 [Actinoplanes sp. NPDC051861]|uniref:hypothetical protein n=1 Tax=Actinoplanes sp. NPDC051861 TaxID=3155170 RepID=UPI003417671B